MNFATLSDINQALHFGKSPEHDFISLGHLKYTEC